MLPQGANGFPGNRSCPAGCRTPITYKERLQPRGFLDEASGALPPSARPQRLRAVAPARRGGLLGGEVLADAREVHVEARVPVDVAGIRRPGVGAGRVAAVQPTAQVVVAGVQGEQSRAAAPALGRAL